MASFCAKCGVPLESSTAFCPTCGTPIATQPVPPFPAAAAKKTSVWKIVLIVVAVLFVLGVLGVGTLGFLGWRAMHSGGNNMVMGQAANVSEADLGASIYPGAVRVEKGSTRIKMLGIETVAASYTTGDPVSSVLSYYQGQLGPNATTTEREGMTMINLSGIDGNAKESVMVVLKPSVLAAGSTQITITHTKIATQ
jgi:hypothetical protein